jgi:RHS repeat-associated protein
MNNAQVVFRYLVSLLAVAVMFGAASEAAQAAPDDATVQRVLQQLSRGVGAAHDVQKLTDHAISSARDTSRGAEARQLAQAQRDLMLALRAYPHGTGSVPALVVRYEQWQAAAEVVRIKLAAHGDRLAQSPDGAGYIARHQKAQSDVLAAFSAVRAVLDPVLAPPAGLPAPTTESLRKAAAEALALLERQHTAPAEAPILRAQPVPFGGLSLAPRQPAVAPAIVPSYETPGEVSPLAEDRVASTYAPLNDEIIAKARSLNNDFVRIYEFVRNGIRNEWYAGAVKGAMGVLRSGAGNDVDQASLLTALLRAAGLNTRYVQGVVEMPLERVAAQIGLRASEAAAVPSALAKAGVAYKPVVRSGRIAAVQVARTWVSAYVPYTNYRGALVDASGKSWIPLDPFDKVVRYTPSNGFFAQNLGADALVAEYQARSYSTSFADFVRLKVQNALTAKGVNESWEAQRSTSAIDALTLDILPNSLPYMVVAVTREAADLPVAEQASVRIRLHKGARASDPVVLDKTLSLAEAISARLTLSYGPASLEDHRVALLYGGMDAVPLYLIGLRGQLKLGGDVVAAATDRVDPGSSLHLSLELSGPWGTQEVVQTVVAGAYHAMVIGGDAPRADTIASSDTERLGARLLDGLGVYYAQQWNDGDRDLAAWLDAGIVRPLPSVTLIGTTVRPALVAGVPVTLEWTGLSIDAALRPVEAVGERAADFLSLSALAGSSLERTVFKDQFAVKAMSADTGLQLASERGVPVLEVTSANVSSLDASGHGDPVKSAVRDLVAQGFKVRMPQQTVALEAWTGSVWQAFKDGRAGFFLSGGLAGGETAEAPEAWTLGFLADALSAMQTEEALNDPMAGERVTKVGAGDGQRGVVGQSLPVPLAVLVQDRHGRPVRGAQVTFSVVAGDAQLEGGSSFTVSTNAIGMASVPVELGKSTGVNSVWILRKPDDEFPTQVGQVYVDVSVASYIGNLHTPEPFTALALPDVLADLHRRDQPVSEGWPAATADVLSIDAEDRFGNPLPNIEVGFFIESTASCPAEGPGGQFKPGAVWNAMVSARACESGTMLGQCGSPSVSIKSASNGLVAAGVILSNEIGGTNVVTVGAQGVSKQYRYRGYGTCVPSATDVTYYGSLDWKGGEFDGEGNLLSAVRPGDLYDRPFLVSIYRSEYPYFIVRNTVRYQPYINWVAASGGISSVTVSNSGSAEVSGQTFKLRTGLVPGQNVATVTADVLVSGIRNSTAGPKEFADTLSVTGTGAAVFGVRPKITGFTSLGTPGGGDPSRIYLDAAGVSLFPVHVNYEIEPASYRTAVNGWQLDLLVDGAWADYATGDSRSGQGKAVLPRALAFDPHNHRYEAKLSSAYAKVESDKVPLPLHQKLIADMRAAGAFRYVDEVNRRVCARQGLVSFVLTQDARATLSYQMLDGSGQPVGLPQTLVSEATYPRGANEVEIDAGQLGSGAFLFTVDATAVADGSVTDRAQSDAEIKLQLANSLPVGQILVQGVNVRNGILTYQTPHLAIPGRGLPFDFMVSYSSAAGGNLSVAGANWSHNLDLGLHVNSCGEVMVGAGDSGSVRFFPGADGAMVPDRGYHGTLIARHADNSWDFFSKDGTRYHYKFHNRRVQWKIDRITDRNGNWRSFEYDYNAFPAPLLTRITSSDGRSFTFTYDSRVIVQPGVATGTPVSLLKSVEGPGGTRVSLEHDDIGNVTSYVVNNRTTSFTYSTDATAPADRYRLISARDAQGNATGYEYAVNPFSVSGDGFVVQLDHLSVSRVTTPVGGTFSFTIDPTSWSSSTVAASPGGTTTYAFNRYGNPTTISDPAGTTTMSWASDDVLMTSKTDGRGVATTYEYDAAGNVTRETVDGRSVSYAYEIQDGEPYRKSILVAKVDRNGNHYGYTLDGSGNVTTEQLPIGTVRHSYASNGDRLSSTDPNGKTSRFEYDAMGNLVALTNPLGIRLETPRDARGRITAQIDGNGNTTTFAYDGQDNLTSQTDALGATRRSNFDAIGNKLQEVDEGGRTTTWTYKVHLPLSMALSGPQGPGGQRSFEYDGAGNKTRETDWKGQVTSYAYDAAHRLTTRTEPLGRSTSYTYDAVGNLLSEATLDRTISHGYDALSRRTRTTDAEGKVWRFEFDGNGNRIATVDPLGRRTEMVYDAMDRLIRVDQPLGRTTRYAYDSTGNKTSETDPNGRITEHAYDSANRLVGTTQADGTRLGFVYDAANNLTRHTDAGGGITQYAYDALNRKTSARDPEGSTTTYAYDALGNLTDETWPNGNALRHSYDLFNRRTNTTDSVGAVGSWEYDAQGNLTAEIDGNGNRTTHSYNALNQRTGSVLPGARGLAYTPDVFGNVLETTDARGHKTTYRYDRLNRLTKTIYADGGVIDITYDDAGNKLTQTDPLGRVTRSTYDALNRVIEVTDPLNQKVTSTYDLVGNLLAQTDKRGTVTEHRYDTLNRRVGTTKAGIELQRLTYTALGQVATQTDANNHRTTYTYDRRGLQLTETAPEGAVTVLQRDALGDVVQTTDPEGRVSRAVYDARRRLTRATNPAGETTAHEYDLNNHKTATLRPNGARTTYVYDGRNFLTEVHEPLGRNTSYQRDANGNLTRLTDPAGRATAYEYDALNRRTSVTYAGGATESHAYDAAGNLLQHIDANGIAVTRNYDVINREVLRTYSVSADGLQRIATTYDANGNKVSVTETYATGARTSTYTYDAFDRQLTAQDGFGAQIAYAYDPNGNRTSLSTQDARITRYGYDGLNRLTGVASPAGNVQYLYDKSGLVIQEIGGNGTSTTTAHDAAQRPTLITLSRGVAVLNLTEYGYDRNGNRILERINRPGGAQVTSYRYDAADRLTGTTRTEGAATTDTTWTYDAADNRLTEAVTTGGATVTRSYTYDARHRLTRIDDSAAGTSTLSYDAQGNLLQKQQGADTTAYVWSARDLLASVSRNGTTLGRYGSDHEGLRVSKEAIDPLQPGAPPRVLHTQWDDDHAVQDRDEAGNVVARYDFAGRRPVALWSAADGTQLLHADALGSIVATTAPDGTVKSETLYDAWGNPVTKAGASANKFAYTGHQADAETGLYYFKARYYDPSIGRFISQDPAEGQDERPESYHKYLYAYANPMVYVDLDGYESVSTMIDNAAEGCGTFSCAGWALLKGVYVVGTFGFASVHDPVRDAYDQGKVTGKQYVAYGIGGGAAAVAVNVATARVGGAVVQASGVVGRIAGSAAVGAAGAAASDAVSQGSQIGAGMKDHYDVAQTVAHAAVGAALGGGIAVVAETAAAAAPYIRSSAQKVKEAVADSTAAVKERFSETVAQTRTVVESAAQSVGSRIKGVVTREGGALGAEGSAVVSKGVAAEPAPQTWRITIGAKLEHEADKIGHAFVSVKPPEGAAVTKGLWPVKPNGQLGFDNVIDPIKGMPGVLRDDSVYLSSTKSVVKTYEVSEAQGMAALEKMAEIESKLAEGKMFYRLLTNQCATFACSVVKAAGVKPPKAGLIKQPRKIAESITREAK